MRARVRWVHLILYAALSLLLVLFCAWLLPPSFLSQDPECAVFVANPPPPALRHCLLPSPLTHPDIPGIWVVALVALTTVILLRGIKGVVRK